MLLPEPDVPGNCRNTVLSLFFQLAGGLLMVSVPERAHHLHLPLCTSPSSSLRKSLNKFRYYMFAENCHLHGAFTCSDIYIYIYRSTAKIEQLARFIIHFIIADSSTRLGPRHIRFYDTNCFALVINFFHIPNPAVHIISAVPRAAWFWYCRKMGIGVVVQEIWRQFDHGKGFL